MSRPGRLDVVQPDGWPRPRGYVNGMLGEGRWLHVAGQIAWDESGRIVSDDFVAQFGRALDNVLAVVLAAGGHTDALASLTIYVTDVAEYRARAAELGAAWRSRLGTHYPAMALVAVTALVEPAAKLEIQAIALLPPGGSL